MVEIIAVLSVLGVLAFLAWAKSKPTRNRNAGPRLFEDQRGSVPTPKETIAFSGAITCCEERDWEPTDMSRLYALMNGVKDGSLQGEALCEAAHIGTGERGLLMVDFAIEGAPYAGLHFMLHGVPQSAIKRFAPGRRIRVILDKRYYESSVEAMKAHLEGGCLAGLNAHAVWA